VKPRKKPSLNSALVELSPGTWSKGQIKLLEYSRRFHIYDSGTTRMVWIRMFFVWKVFGSMKVEAMSCKDEWLGTAEMFREDS